MKKLVFVMAIISLFLIAACAQQPSVVQPVQEAEGPEIIVQSQAISNNMVTIEDVNIDKPGYVVIHKVVDNAPGAVIGNSDLLNGEAHDVEIKVSGYENEKELIAMLHYDDGDNVYGFPQDEDNPVTANGQVVMQKFSITSAESPTSMKVPAPGNEDVEEMVVAESEVVKIDMTAKKWEFEPGIVTVKEGDRVKLNIKSVDVTHGFSLPDFGVSENLAPGKTVAVEFTADKKGTFTFFGSVYCGSGHRDLKGTLVVE